MSKALKEYGSQKGVSLTCARRLSEFLGEDLVQSKVKHNILGVELFLYHLQKPNVPSN